MFRLNDIIDLLAMVNSIHWYCHLFSMVDYHVLCMALELEVKE